MISRGRAGSVVRSPTTTDSREDSWRGCRLVGSIGCAFKTYDAATDATDMAVRGSRREKSVYTYGLLGRVLWTLGGQIVLYLLLSPVVRLLRGGLINAGIGAMAPLFFGVAGVVLLVWVFPRFIRDTWQPASVAGDEPVELPQSIPAESDAVPISERTAPIRW